MSKLASVLVTATAVVCLVVLWLGLGSGGGSLDSAVAAQQVKAPSDPPKELKDLLKRALDEEGFDDQGSESGNRPFFDDFSWQMFIILNWPAQDGERGKANKEKAFGERADQVVWETWKTGPEIVPPDGTNPTKWDTAQAPRKVLARVNKFEDFRQAGFGVDEAPLIDQRKKYVRYEMAVNEVEFNEIFSKKYYTEMGLDKAAMAAPGGKVEFPAGSIEVKASWRELPDAAGVLQRFYWRNADVVDWDENGKERLTRTKVGLVGFHIVTKTKQRPNWIWSTFEHEDNVVSSKGGLNPPSFNGNPKGTAWVSPGTQPPTGWEKITPKKPLPKLDKVEVSRKLDLKQFPDTKKTNDLYRGHPQIKDTVWTHYQLIRTQWPIKAPGTSFDGKPSPKADVANATMETYHQRTTCMACHENATKSRFVYFLELRVNPRGAKAELKKTLNALKQ